MELSSALHSRKRTSARFRCLLLAGGIAAASAPASAESLADAIAAAYANNPALVTQRYRQKAIDEQYVQARSGYGPTLNVSADATYQYVDTTLINQDGNQGQVTATLRQPLYTSGQLRGRVAAARADVRQGQENLREVEQQQVQNVIQVYAAVVRDQQRLAVSRENVLVLRQQLTENRARRRVEDVTITDVAQADARLAAADAQLATIQSLLDVSRGQYLQVVGHYPGTLEPLPDLAGMPGTLDQALSVSELNNPSLRAATFQEQASRADVAAAKGARGPVVSATAQGIYANQISPFDSRDRRLTFVGAVSVSQPLFAAGAISSRIRGAQAQNDADQAEIDRVRREALQAVTAAWTNLAAARVGLEAGLRQVQSAQIAFAGMQREARNGLRSTIEVLNAEQELQSAQLGLLQTRYTEYLQRAVLLAAMGTLRAQTIAPEIEVYDPEINFRRVRNRGMTPLEPIAQALDRIGSAGPNRPPSPELSGVGMPRPDQAAPLPPTPSAELARGPLVPITKSPVVPASALPGGIPQGDKAIPPAPSAANRYPADPGTPR